MTSTPLLKINNLLSFVLYRYAYVINIIGDSREKVIKNGVKLTAEFFKLGCAVVPRIKLLGFNTCH